MSKPPDRFAARSRPGPGPPAAGPAVASSTNTSANSSHQLKPPLGGPKCAHVARAAFSSWISSSFAFFALPCAAA